MWGNIAKLQGVIGNAVDQVKKFQNELESSLDAAVGADTAVPETIVPTTDTGAKDDGSKKEETSTPEIKVETSSPLIAEPVREPARDSDPMETVSLVDSPSPKSQSQSQSQPQPTVVATQQEVAVVPQKTEAAIESSTSLNPADSAVKVESAAAAVVVTKPATTATEPVPVESAVPATTTTATTATTADPVATTTSSAKSGKNNKNAKGKGGKGASQQQQPAPAPAPAPSTQPQKQVPAAVVESKQTSVAAEKKVEAAPATAGVSFPDLAKLALVSAEVAAAAATNTMRDDYELRMRELMDQQTVRLGDLQSKFDTAMAQSKDEVTGLREQLALATQQQQQSIMSSNSTDAARDEVINTANRRATEAEAATKRVKAELDAAVAAAAERDQQLAKLTERVSKLNEVVAERERALETMAGKMAESHKALEEAQRKLGDLATEVAEKDNKLRSLQSQSTAASTGEGDVRKQLQRAQEVLKEKEERMAAFEHEGKSLAKKQSDMEKEVRKTKGDLKAKEGEVTKLKERQAELVKAIEEMQDLVRKNESDASNASKSLNAMQAVSQASTDKLARLEGEIQTKADELASQRRALETAWNENNELKRSVAELRADRDDLRRQIGEGTSRVMETESSRRDIEQREAVLRATNKQLQDSLQRQMGEASVREERLRDEVGEMRKRWQEAVSSRETLASELGSATAPLLRQISSMQEAMRVKQESWQAVESSLSERALRAESAAEMADHRKALLEEQVVEMKQQVSLLGGRLSEAQASLSTNDGIAEKLRKLEQTSAEKMNELESRLALEAGQKQSLQASLRELELRHKIDQQDSKDAVELTIKQSENKMNQLKSEIESLRDELQSERSKTGGRRGATSGSRKPTNLTTMTSSSSGGKLEGIGSDNGGPNDADNTGEGGSGSGGRGKHYGMGMTPAATLPSGEVSYAATERVHQQIQQREEDARSLSTQLHQLQASRDALLEEVNYLSARNAKLEEDTQAVPKLRQETQTSKKRIEVLLVMLGEKEEEVEAVLSDLKEVKNMYRAQMEDLLTQVMGPGEVGTTNTNPKTNRSPTTVPTQD